MENRIKGMTIQRKLIASYILILAIPIIGFALFYFDDFKANVEDNVFRTSHQDVRNMKSDIERNIETYESVLQCVISNRELLNFLAKQGKFSTEDLIEFNKYHIMNLERICNSNPSIYQLRFFVNNKGLYEIAPILYSEARIKNTSWRDDVINLKGENYWRFNHMEEPALITGRPVEEVVSLYRDVLYVGRCRIGIIEVNMRAKDFFYGMYQDMAHDDSFICVIDGSDLIYWNNENAMLKDRGWDINEVKKELVKSTENAGYGEFILNLSEEEIAVTYDFVPQIDSYIYKLSSLTALTRSVKKTRNNIIIMTIIVIMIISIVTYIITALILKKLRIIIDTMRKIQEGNLDVDIPVWDGDEIGELAHHFKKMLDNIKELISVILKKQAAVKDAEIRALQSQINSHFIYNVLESIKMMAEIEGQHEISNSITSLGKLMHYSMNWENHYVRLKDELDYVKNYILLSNVRYDYEVRLSIDVNSEFMNYEIPKMSIQPLVENAVKHGIKPKDADGDILIRSWTEGQMIFIEVRDNGVGISYDDLDILRKSIEENLDKAEDDKRGIGLENVNERLKLFYGMDYGLSIKSEKNMYTAIVLRLPYEQML